jgi:hypothetical protein
MMLIQAVQAKTNVRWFHQLLLDLDGYLTSRNRNRNR